jgi:flagellar biosynthetic protein FlhB
MAEDSDLEKTEPASSKRLEKAREDGDVPRSRELTTSTLLLAAGAGFWLMGSGIAHSLQTNLISGLTLSRELAFDPMLLLVRISAQLNDLLWAFFPLALLLLLVAAFSPALIGGWVFSSKVVMPDFGRMNPLKGVTNIVSKNAAAELVKALLKATLISVVAYIVMSSQKNDMFALSHQPLKSGIEQLGHLLLTGFLGIVAALVLIAAIDVPYQVRRYANKLKMTKEEVRQEAKESDGNPQIKARVRQMQREMARRRMMSEIPHADVVITNPTHYAVALKYKDAGMRAPVVVAKGADAVALKIREIAAEHHVPMLEAPPLARALHAHADLGDEIPEQLYSAVAEVLAYVFQLRTYGKQGGVKPKPPVDLAVPEALDPHNALALDPSPEPGMAS